MFVRLLLFLSLWVMYMFKDIGIFKLFGTSSVGYEV